MVIKVFGTYLVPLQWEYSFYTCYGYERTCTGRHLFYKVFYIFLISARTIVDIYLGTYILLVVPSVGLAFNYFSNHNFQQ